MIFFKDQRGVLLNCNKTNQKKRSKIANPMI